MVSQSKSNSNHHDEKGHETAYFPEVIRTLGDVLDVVKVHAVVRDEERKRQEDDCDISKDKYRDVVTVGNDDQLICFYEAKLKELCDSDPSQFLA